MRVHPLGGNVCFAACARNDHVAEPGCVIIQGFLPRQAVDVGREGANDGKAPKWVLLETLVELLKRVLGPMTRPGCESRNRWSQQSPVAMAEAIAIKPGSRPDALIVGFTKSVQGNQQTQWSFDVVSR